MHQVNTMIKNASFTSNIS